MDLQYNYPVSLSFELILTRSKKERENVGRPLADTDGFENVKDMPAICCRNCHYPVTLPSERIEVASAHHHTFANPNGYLFEIGCFRNADGCGAIGIRTAEFSWFRNYTWQIGICRKCRNHLGWLFQSLNDRFYGLIMDRLIEQ